jgi:hypothetical protein
MRPPERLWLPALLRDVADAFGEDAALTLARGWGGQYLRLPAEADADHPIARQLGVKVLRFLIERHDKLERIVIPKGPRDDVRLRRRMIAEMTAAGRTANDIAAATGLHVRTVHAVKAKLRDDRQRELFSDRRAG